MKKATRVVLGCGAALLAISGARAADPAPVDRVVVYADRAEVTRVLTAACKNDRAEAVFPLLPTTVDVRTLRPSASGKARAVGTTSRVVPVEENRDERVAKLQKELREIEDRIRVFDEEREGLSQRMSVLGRFQQYFLQIAAEEARSERPDLTRWASVLDQSTQERLAAARRGNEIQMELRKLNRARQRLERRLANLSPSSVAEALRVEVAVECGGESQTRVSLSYVTPQATWRPEYDLRYFPPQGAKVGPGEVELTVGVAVQQSTGEDWENAILVLSTSKPRLGAEAPYPAPLTINGHPAGEEKVLVEVMERREGLAGPGGPSAGAPVSAALEDRGQSFVLTMPHRTTVRSDGRPYWMPLDLARARGEAVLYTVPKLRQTVFQVVRLKNPVSYPLMAGRVHLYRRGSFVGDTSLQYTAPGEPMEVSLGQDDEIRVERKAVRSQDREAGMLSSTQHLERSYQVQVTNNSARQQVIEVRENIPVSKTEEVRVELVKDKTTRGFELDAHRGFLTWKLVLKAGEKRDLNLAYTVHLPESWQVNFR
jgi:uncharacterized protein (TIGR02231 family)